MASIRKKGDRWIAEVRTKGKYKSKLHDSKAAAKQWAYETEHKLSRSPEILTGKTLADAMTRYATEVTPGKKGARWEVIRIERLQRDALAYVQLNALSGGDLSDWMERRKKDGLKGSSINRELNLISAILAKARKAWKWMEGNPMQDIERPKDPPPRDRLITDAEVQRICEALEYVERTPVVSQRQKIAVAFLLAIETAMRQGEIWGLEWQHVHWQECYLVLPDTKNGTARTVPLSTRALALLQMLHPGTGRVLNMQQASAATLFRRAVQLAGITGVTFHDTRHLAITRLARKLNMLELARMVGHRDPRNLMAYYNPTPRSIAELLG